MLGPGTPRDVCGSVNRRRVMSCIGKMLDTQFPQPPGWVSNCVEDAHHPAECDSSKAPSRVQV